MIWPQTCLAYPAAVMSELGAEVAVMDCIAERTSWHDFEKKFKSLNPKYVVHHISDPTAENDARVAAFARKAGARSIAIGPHVTGLPLETMNLFPDLDFIAKNEIEGIVPGLIQACEKNKELDQVPGIVFRRNGQIVNNPDSPVIQDLDSLPIPRHDLLPLNRYKMPLIGKRYTYVLSSRGCPFHCSFCVEAVLSWHKVRYRSARSIIHELEWLQNELDVINIMFQADLFTFNKKWVTELCEGIIGANLKVRWTCNSRVDTVNEDLLKLMKTAGCWLIAWGLESGSQEVLDHANKGITLQKTRESIHQAHRAGIKNWGYFIIGLPGETRGTIQQTIDLSKELPLTLTLFHVAAPYMGTPFYKEAHEKGWLLSDNWDAFDMNDQYNVSYPDLPAREIEKGLKRAFREWYARPSVIWNLMKNAGGISYIWWFVRTAIDNIKWVMQKKTE